MSQNLRGATPHTIPLHGAPRPLRLPGFMEIPAGAGVGLLVVSVWSMTAKGGRKSLGEAKVALDRYMHFPESRLRMFKVPTGSLAGGAPP